MTFLEGGEEKDACLDNYNCNVPRKFISILKIKAQEGFRNGGHHHAHGGRIRLPAGIVRHPPDGRGAVRSDVVVMRRAIADGTAFQNHWVEGDWQAPRVCSSSATFTRTVSCVDNDTEEVVADSRCGGRKPPETRVDEDRSGCTYRWATGEWSSYSSTCSTSSTRTRTVECRRSDETPSPDSSCTGTKPDAKETESNVTGCENAVANGGFEASQVGSETFRVAVRNAPGKARSGSNYGVIDSIPNQRHTSADFYFSARGNTTYRISAWLRQETPGSYTHVVMNRRNASGFSVQSVEATPGATYSEISMIFTNTSNRAVGVSMGLYSDGDALLVDDISAVEEPS